MKDERGELCNRCKELYYSNCECQKKDRILKELLIERLSVIELKDSDYIILESDEFLDIDRMKAIREAFKEHLNIKDVLILSGGITLKGILRT